MEFEVITSRKNCILVFNISVWFGHLNKNIVITAGEIVGRQQRTLDDLYSTAVDREALFIIADTKHPLHTESAPLRATLQKRPMPNKKIYKGSFILVQ